MSFTHDQIFAIRVAIDDVLKELGDAEESLKRRYEVADVACAIAQARNVFNPAVLTEMVLAELRHPDPDIIAVLRVALEKAWFQLPADRKKRRNKDRMARALLRAANAGNLEPEALAEIALAAGLEPLTPVANSSAAASTPVHDRIVR
jgi:hypothetical protein